MHIPYLIFFQFFLVTYPLGLDIRPWRLFTEEELAGKDLHWFEVDCKDFFDCKLRLMNEEGVKTHCGTYSSVYTDLCQPNFISNLIDAGFLDYKPTV